jgi:site-specific recombinase XerC
VPDVDVARSEIVVRRLKRNREDRFFVPRGQMALLRALVRGRASGPVFATAGGSRLSARHAQRRLAEWLSRADVERHASPHALRHAFAMRLYRKTGDLLLVKQALGQQSIASTLIYARSSDQAVRTALEAI